RRSGNRDDERLRRRSCASRPSARDDPAPAARHRSRGRRRARLDRRGAAGRKRCGRNGRRWGGDAMSVAERLRLDGGRLLVTPADGVVGSAVARRGVERGATVVAGPPCDVLVTVAGLGPLPPFLELQADAWDAAVREHADGFYGRCRESVPAMAEARDGAVVAIVSGAALGLEEAVIGLTRALAPGLAELGVRANAVRVGDAAPEAVAELALYLASPAAGYVTGVTLVA